MIARIKGFFGVRASRDSLKLDKQRLRWQVVTLLALAVLLTLILELLNRRSFVKTAVFIYEHPLMLLLNFGIVLSMLSIGQLVKRRFAVIITVTLVWLVLGVTNFIVISFRTQPFTLADVFLIKDMFSLITVYFSWLEIILIFLGVAGVIALIVLLFVRAPRRERVPYLPTFLACALVAALTFAGAQLGMNSGYIDDGFGTLKDAYEDYGFAYTFLDTFADLGISRPKGYGQKTVEEINVEPGINEADATPPPKIAPAADDSKPNIVYVQLESFFDADILRGMDISESFTPNFSRLLKEWPSGQLYVPVVGGGTANTEFEMLTGMNLDFFGAGEVPYYTVMRDAACESLCYVLARHGYTSTAVHNYMATFYGRNLVFANLGFDVFESMEYMDDLDYGELGWAADGCIADSVIDAMNATPGADFVFAVTVSTHGKYSADELMLSADRIKVNDPGEYISAVQLQNFINLAYDLDAELVNFITALENYPEPIVCVFYGDHLPALDWDITNIDSGDLFRTQYFIWNNYSADFKAYDCQAYRLTAELLKQLGLDGGVLFSYHQSQNTISESVGYLAELEILEYDLFNEMYAFGGENPYEATELKLGIDDIVINSVEYGYGRLLIKGDNFNEFSVILINGEQLSTAYVDKFTLAAVLDELPVDIEYIEIAQITNENIELSRTAQFEATRMRLK